MTDIIASLLKWAENTPLAAAIRQSTWLYPALEIFHIVGIVIVVGAALMFDLRLLGFSKKLPVNSLGKHLLTSSKRGLFLVIPSGILLFITDAETLGYDPVFWTKMLLLLIAGLNALTFHRFITQRSSLSGAKISACISVLVWIAVIACGRLLAY